MDVQGYQVPDGLLYTKEHEWAKQEAGIIRIGITDYAAKTLNDVVYVMTPIVYATVEQLKSMGTVESIKAASEIYSPVSGTVTRVNGELDTHPELVNKSPYGEGWLVEVKPMNFAAESMSLLDAPAYPPYQNSLLKS